MREELRCEIVQDLLPSYIDGLTNDATNQAVEEHLFSCETCRKMYEHMKEDETEPIADQADVKADIDYLKKIKRHNRFDIILVAVILLALFAAVAYHYIYQVGFETSIDDIVYEVTYDNENNYIDVNMRFVDYKKGMAQIESTVENGIVNLEIYSIPKQRNYENTFGYSIDREKCRQISIDGVIVWADGELIGRKTSDIYKTKTAYIGDIVACGKAADAIGIKNQFGGYQNELTTSAKPYDWRLIIQHPIQTEKKNAAKEKMIADACVLLAMIGNLDSVTWDYITDEGQEVMTITKEEATEIVGCDIKECSQSAASLQKMLIQVGIILEETPYIETDPMGEVPFGFELNIGYKCDSTIYGMACQFYMNDVCVGSSVTVFVAAYQKNLTEDEWTMTVDTDYLTERFTNEEIKNLSLTLSIRDEDGTEYPVCDKKALSAEYGETYAYIVTGSYEDGFTLTAQQ